MKRKHVDDFMHACFVKRNYKAAEHAAYVATFDASRRYDALRVLGYATLALGELERAERAYRALADEYGLQPGDLLAPAREDLATSKLPGAEPMRALLAPPKVDRAEATAFWKSLDDDLRAVLRTNLDGAPAKGALTGKWLDAVFMQEALAIEQPVKKLAPLARMPRLVSLRIDGELPMLPFRELAKLTKLKRLHIDSDCDLRTIDFVAKLHSLETLIVFESDRITDLACLADLNALTFLQLGDTQVRDVAFLRGKSKLENLTLTVAKSVTDFRALADLTALEAIELRATGIKSLAPLAGATKLERVQIHGSDFHGTCDLRSLAGLENKPALFWVEVERAPKLDDISALTNATNLKRVILNEAPKITDFSPLAKLTNIEHLELYGAHALTDLAVLGAKPKLQTLEITYSAVADLAPLAKWKSLSRLSYYHTKAKQKLHGIGKLTSLDLTVDPDDFAPADAKKLSRMRPSRE
jgi:hypothetical protein